MSEESLWVRTQTLNKKKTQFNFEKSIFQLKSNSNYVIIIIIPSLIHQRVHVRLQPNKVNYIKLVLLPKNQ